MGGHTLQIHKVGASGNGFQFQNRPHHPTHNNPLLVFCQPSSVSLVPAIAKQVEVRETLTHSTKDLPVDSHPPFVAQILRRLS